MLTTYRKIYCEACVIISIPKYENYILIKQNLHNFEHFKVLYLAQKYLKLLDLLKNFSQLGSCKKKKNEKHLKITIE